MTTPTSPGPVREPANPTTGPGRARPWPVLLLAAPAFIAIWSGWVGLGRLTGFGPVELLPGIADGFTLNTAITLPIGMETYAAYALHVMLTRNASARARTFARWSAAGSLLLGAAGQVAYHLMTAAGVTTAPWQITAAVACLPVAVLGMGAALAHLVHDTTPAPDTDTAGPGTEQTSDSAGPDTSSPPHAPEKSSVHGDEQGDEQGGEQGGEQGEVSRPAAPGATRPPRARGAGTKTSTKTRGKTRGKAGARTDTAARIAQLSAAEPDLTQAEIARRLGITDRTVRRHLLATPTAPDTNTTQPAPTESGAGESGVGAAGGPDTDAVPVAA